MCQLALFINGVSVWWVIALLVPLIMPIAGVWRNRLYTFKWIGFLTMLYFSIGVSESVMNPDLKLYGMITTIFSMILFVSSIYQVRYLKTIDSIKTQQ